MVENTSCPVLVVPSGAKYSAIDKIAFAVELNDGNEPDLTLLAAIAKAFDASLFLLHITGHTESAKEAQNTLLLLTEKLKKQTGHQKISFEMIEGDNVTEELQKYNTMKGIDILGMVTKKRTVLGKIFDSSLTNEMTTEAKTPVLVFQKKKA